MPQHQLDALFSAHFSLAYHAIEQYPEEVVTGIVNNRFCDSIFMSGGPRLGIYEPLLRGKGFRFITVLRDPYEELAERLLLLQYAAKQDFPPSLMAHLSSLERVVPLAGTFDIGDDHRLKQAFLNLDDEQRAVLSNPFVRMLACEGRQTPTNASVALALQKLAEFDAVGLATRYDDFKVTLSEVLKVDILRDHRLSEVSWSTILAPKLAQIDRVKDMLALDVALYTEAQKAIFGVLDAPATRGRIAR